jgi:hypothetical protein
MECAPLRQKSCARRLLMWPTVSPPPSVPRPRLRGHKAVTADAAPQAQDAAADTGSATAAPPHEDGRHNGAREQSSVARRQLRLSPEAAAAVAALQAAGRGEPLSPRAAKLLTATDGLVLGIRWRVFGRHAYCAFPFTSPCWRWSPYWRGISDSFLFRSTDGNGQPRALLRGWVHLCALVYATWVLTRSRQLGPWRLHPAAQRFAWWTHLGYIGSCVFHLVPYATLRSYQLALCFDFMCITYVPTPSCVRTTPPILLDSISDPSPHTHAHTGWPSQARLRLWWAGSIQLP